MDRSRHTRLLWLAFVLCVPLPFFLVETGFEPVASILQKLAIVLQLISIEGRSGAVSIAAWLLAVQALVGIAALGVVSVAVTRLADRVAGDYRGAIVYTVVIILFAVALTQPIYRTPFRAAALSATLTEVFE